MEARRVEEQYTQQLEDFFAAYPSLDEDKVRAKIQLILSSKLEFNPDHIQDDPEVTRGKYYKHQVVAYRFIIAFQRTLLFHGTGSGKTCAFIAASEYYRQLAVKGKGPIKRALVIVPNKAVEDDFKRQLICSCTATGTYDTEYVRSATNAKTRKTRINQLISEFYTLTTYRSLAIWLKANWDNQDLIKRTYSNTIIFFDEVQSINSEDDKGEDDDTFIKEKSGRGLKSEKAKITNKEAYHYISGMFDIITDSNIVLASGTPMLNDIYEMILVLNLLLKKEDKIDVNSNDKNAVLEAIRKGSKGYVSYVKEPESAVHIEYGDSKIRYKPFLPEQYSEVDEYLYNSLNTPLRWNADDIDFSQEAFIVPLSSYQKMVYTSLEHRLVREAVNDKKGNYLAAVKKLTTVSNLAYPAFLTDTRQAPIDIMDSSLYDYNEVDVQPLVSEMIKSTKQKAGKLDSIYLTETEKGVVAVKQFKTPKILTMNGVTFQISSLYDLLVLEATGTYIDDRGRRVEGSFPMLYNFSPKNHFLVNYALDEERRGEPRVHYIYCEPIRSSGVIHLQLTLEANGYVRFVPKDKGLTVSVGAGYCASTETLYNLDDPENDYKRFAIITSATTSNQRNIIFSLLNSRDNWDGKLIRFIIATAAIKVGVNLFNISTIHIWNGHWGPGRIKQARNRALRGISQKYIQERIGRIPTVRVLYYNVGYMIGALSEEENVINTVEDAQTGDMLVDAEGTPLSDLSKIYSKSGWSAMQSIGYISPDLDQYINAREKEYNIRLAETIAAKNSFDCRINLARNGLELGFCESADEQPLPTDTSTYDTYFADTDVEWIGNIVESVLRKFYTISITDLLLLMKDIRKVNEKYFYLSIYQLVHSKHAFMDFFGRKCYVREESGTLFLTSDQSISGEDSLHAYNTAYYDRFLITQRLLSSGAVLSEYVVEAYRPKLEGLKKIFNERLGALLNPARDIDYGALHDSALRVISEFRDLKQITWLMKHVIDTFMNAYGNVPYFAYLLPYPGAILDLVRSGTKYYMLYLDPKLSPSPFYYVALIAISNHIYVTVKPNIINELLNTKVYIPSEGKKRLMRNKVKYNISPEQIDWLNMLFSTGGLGVITPIITIVVPHTEHSGVGYALLSNYSNAKGDVWYRSSQPTTSRDVWTEVPQTSAEYNGFNLLLKYTIYIKLKSIDEVDTELNPYRMWAYNLNGYIKINDLYAVSAKKEIMMEEKGKVTGKGKIKGQNCDSLNRRVLARYMYVLGIEVLPEVDVSVGEALASLQATFGDNYDKYDMENWSDEEIFAAYYNKWFIPSANIRPDICIKISRILFELELKAHYDNELPDIMQFILTRTGVEIPEGGESPTFEGTPSEESIAAVATSLAVRPRQVGYLLMAY
jgi:hypothetical protein